MDRQELRLDLIKALIPVASRHDLGGCDMIEKAKLLEEYIMPLPKKAEKPEEPTSMFKPKRRGRPPKNA